MTAFPQSGTPGEPTLPAPPADGKYRVLIVEDDPSIARLLMVTLTKTGFDVRHAPDGPSALEAFRQTNPHIAVLDLWLPGLDGQKVCLEMRKTSTIPIIVMTASDSENVEMQSFKMGADDFVTKPFNPQLLVARIVANLRRTYRYGAVQAEAEEAPASNGQRDLAAIAGIRSTPDKPEEKIPAGWAKCEYCNYMGPRVKFEAENSLGRRGLMCPNCKQADFITFSIG